MTDVKPPQPPKDTAPAHHRLRQMSGRDPHEEFRVSTPLELLFDLTFVVAFGTAAAEFATSLSRNHVGSGLAGFAFATFAVWWAWILCTSQVQEQLNGLPVRLGLGSVGAEASTDQAPAESQHLRDGMASLVAIVDDQGVHGCPDVLNGEVKIRQLVEAFRQYSRRAFLPRTSPEGSPRISTILGEAKTTSSA